ncbi:hypothetical protein J6590_052513 [Homalodisca vitripennis]|nr:hypothetical protein J6590_052513 [Homalodisca vitripennis]
MKEAHGSFVAARLKGCSFSERMYEYNARVGNSFCWRRNSNYSPQEHSHSTELTPPYLIALKGYLRVVGLRYSATSSNRSPQKSVAAGRLAGKNTMTNYSGQRMNDNLYADGREIYSYSPVVRGQATFGVIFDTDHTSVTTSKLPVPVEIDPHGPSVVLTPIVFLPGKYTTVLPDDILNNRDENYTLVYDVTKTTVPCSFFLPIG